MSSESISAMAKSESSARGNMKKILIVDGLNFIMRARYSVPVWMQKDPNGVVYTFFRSLRAQIADHSPDKVYFVLEGRPTARLAEHSEYKGTRVSDKDELFWTQWKTITDILKDKLPVSVVRHGDFECDDVVSYLAEHKHADDQVTVVSTDTDFIQIYNRRDNFVLYNPVKKDQVQAPEHDYVVWKALRGDGCDNIEGFKGIGDKRALDMVQDRAKLENFLQSGVDFYEKFNRNKFLITFHDLRPHSDQIVFWESQHKYDEVRDLFQSFGFKSITSDKSWDTFVNTFKTLE